MSRISKHWKDQKPSQEEWLELLFRIYIGSLAVANLTGLRDRELACLRSLEKLLGYHGGTREALEVEKCRSRYFLDTGDLARALEGTIKMRSLAEALGEKEEMASALTWQATIHRERSEYEKAVDLYKQAEAMTDNPRLKAEIKQELGLTHSYLNQVSMAEKLLHQALEYFQRLGSLEMIADIMNDLGVCYFSQKDNNRARVYFQNAMEIYLRIGYKLGSGTAAGNLVPVLIHEGEIIRAQEMARKCLSWGWEIEDQITIARGYEKIADIEKILGHFKEALEGYLSAYSFAARTGDRLMECVLLGLQAEVLAEQRLYSQAEEDISRALTIAEEMEDNDLKGRILNNRGRFLFRKGSYTEALEYWSRILCEKKGGRTGRAEALLEVARCHLGLGDIDLARERYIEIEPEEKSLGILWSIGYHAVGMKIFMILEEDGERNEHALHAKELLFRLREKNSKEIARAIIEQGMLSEFYETIGPLA